MFQLIATIAPFFLGTLLLLIGISYFRSRYYQSFEKRSREAFLELMEKEGFEKLSLSEPEYDHIKNNLVFFTFWGDIYREASSKKMCMLSRKTSGSHQIYVEAEAHKTLRIAINLKRITFFRPLVIVPLNLQGALEDNIMIMRRSLKYLSITGKAPALSNPVEGFEKNFLILIADRKKTRTSLDEKIQKILLDQCGKYPLDGKEDLHNLTSPQNVIVSNHGIAISARPTDLNGLHELIELGSRLATEVESLSRAAQPA